MRKDELRDAFDGIDESIVEKFIREDERIIKHKKEILILYFKMIFSIKFF